MPTTTTKSDKGVAVKESSKQSAADRSARLKAVELAVEQIERQFGTGSIMKLGEGMRVHVETIPTGSLALDLALGGGFPKGRIIEIYGP
ncbi:MAG: recombination protein RecA [Patescibacteria group bacterium]|nr:recombination protein RecA [Patescibacteria group bacterium]